MRGKSSDGGCGQPHGQVPALRGLRRAANRCRIAVQGRQMGSPGSSDPPAVRRRSIEEAVMRKCRLRRVFEIGCGCSKLIAAAAALVLLTSTVVLASEGEKHDMSKARAELTDLVHQLIEAEKTRVVTMAKQTPTSSWRRRALPRSPGQTAKSRRERACCRRSRKAGKVSREFFVRSSGMMLSRGCKFPAILAWFAVSVRTKEGV